MIKSILLTSAAILAGGSALAAPLDPAFAQGQITRGEAYAIRSCGDAYGPKDDVCYNQNTTGEVFPLSRGIGLTVDRTRVVRINCSIGVDRSDKTTRGQVATEYCPQVAAGTLAPAPFLQ
mgnify:CR=1 FL=1